MGLAFQLIDDAIDYELHESEPCTSTAAGKPVAVDLEQGLVTGPLLLAAHDETELRAMLRGGWTEKQIRKAVRERGACERTRLLAAEHAQAACHIASSLRSSDGSSEALVHLVQVQLDRRQ